MPSNSIIRIAPALPCCTWQDQATCGKPASVATLYPLGSGQYILQPICEDCTRSMANIYNVLGWEADMQPKEE